MRRLLLAVAVLCVGACAAPEPCTQALCPLPSAGSYRVVGWNHSVTITPDTPALPIVSDSFIDVVSGSVQFRNRDAVLRASEGTSFRFNVSTGSVAVATVVVDTGVVAVSLSSGAPFGAPLAGVPYSLPVPD